MDDLRTTADLVHTVLKENKRARNSDNYLYYCVIRIIGARSGINIEKMSAPNFFLHMKEYNMPAFETVRRTRQKIQHDYPELSGCNEVEAQRILNEERFRGYARMSG